MPILKTRVTNNTGTWNVRTMWGTEVTSQIVLEIRKYNLTVIVVSEAHLTQAGRKRLAPEEVLLPFGNEEEMPCTHEQLHCCPKKYEKHR